MHELFWAQYTLSRTLVCTKQKFYRIRALFNKNFQRQLKLRRAIKLAKAYSMVSLSETILIWLDGPPFELRVETKLKRPAMINWWTTTILFLNLKGHHLERSMNIINPHQNDQGRKGPCFFQRLIALKCLKCQKI
jgi:hypothetical protein